MQSKAIIVSASVAFIRVTMQRKGIIVSASVCGLGGIAYLHILLS